MEGADALTAQRRDRLGQSRVRQSSGDGDQSSVPGSSGLLSLERFAAEFRRGLREGWVGGGSVLSRPAAASTERRRAESIFRNSITSFESGFQTSCEITRTSRANSI